jgi:hypothetical protein
MNAENNHGTCWVMQVASFAKLTGNKELLQFCRDRYKTVLLPGQMAKDGSFPSRIETNQTLWLFTCLILMPWLWSVIFSPIRMIIFGIFNSAMEEGSAKGIEFLFPYVNQKDKWPYAKT